MFDTEERQRLTEVLVNSHLFPDMLKEHHKEIIADYLLLNGVVVRPRAEWETECGTTVCSICHSSAPVYTVKLAFGTTQMRVRRTKFCPHCGAIMIGE